MKMIELKAEWILTSLPIFLNIAGDGKVGVETNILTDAKWIILALNTLSVHFEEYEYVDVDTIYIGFEFSIDDLKDDCPNFYQTLKEKNDKINH